MMNNKIFKQIKPKEVIVYHKYKIHSHKNCDCVWNSSYVFCKRRSQETISYSNLMVGFIEEFSYFEDENVPLEYMVLEYVD